MASIFGIFFEGKRAEQARTRDHCEGSGSEQGKQCWHSAEGRFPRAAGRQIKGAYSTCR